MEKEEFGMELFSKEYVKIKDPNELISKDNLTGSDKLLIFMVHQKKWVILLFKGSPCRPL